MSRSARPPSSGPSGVSMAARRPATAACRVADVDAPARQGRRDVLAELGVEVGGGEVGRLEDAVHEGADLDADRHLRRAATARRASQPTCSVVVERRRGRRARDIGSSSSTTCSSGSLATRAS